MRNISYLSILFCLFIINVNGQEEQFTVKGNIKSIRDSIRVSLSCTDGKIIIIYADSLGNYSITRSIDTNSTFGINDGKLYCALFFLFPDYKRCGYCPHTLREETTLSEQSRRLSVSLDSINKEIVVNATLTEEMISEHLSTSVFFNKNSVLFSNYFSSDTLLDCTADYLLNCCECFMEIIGYADNKEDNQNQLAEQRAEKVYNLLIKRGVNPKYMEHKRCTNNNTVSGTNNELKSSDKQSVNNHRVDFVIRKNK